MAVPIQSVGKLGDPYTNLPKVYTRGNFEETVLKDKYGSDPSRRDRRQFKRYLKSDAGIADRQTYIDAENAKEQSSYSAYAKALGAQSKARMLAAKADFDKAIQKFDTPVEPAQPPITPSNKPTVIPRSDAEWNRIAAEHGFKDMAEVKAWQAANGLVDDGKFGNNSLAYFKANKLGKYQRTPVEETSPDFTGPVRPPKPSSDASVQPGTSPQSTKFSFDNFIKNNNSTIHWIGGKQYARYDPKGHGDFYVDESGNTYKANWGGDLGNALDANKSAFHNDLNVEAGYKWRDLLNNIQASYQKQGGTMNRINYFQQGGAAPQQDIKAQVTALVQAAMQGDQKATQQVNKIMEAAKAGDQQAMQIAQLMEQVIKELQGKATSAKWGTKLGYIRSLKYAKGGKTCPACEKGKQIEMKACGGKKAKKRYFGGLI